MAGFIYVVARDYGFAPNPFFGICTLSTCKPGIREHAQIGDWIIGEGSAQHKQKNKLVYLMQVSEKITFNEYWNNSKYYHKKPVMNGSLKKMNGDNIYFYDDIEDEWIQADSHHSEENGQTNEYNLNRDTKSKYVLVSDKYYYFGGAAIEIPAEFRDAVCWNGRNYKRVKDTTTMERFIRWIEENYYIGYYGDPLLFEKFQRYDGVS